MVLLEQHAIHERHRLLKPRGEVYENDSDRTGIYKLLAVISKTIIIVLLLVIALLIIRFLTSLLTINEGDALTRLLFDTSTPLITPFQKLFSAMPESYNPRLEVDTALAIVAYSLLAGLFSMALRRKKN